MPASDHERVVLVDSADTQIGVLDKMEAHRRGTLHRAFSVSVSDGKGRLLLQKRARGKYHSGGLWTNTCCGHPRPREEVLAAARRRLMEEMGFACPLEPLFRTRYCADVSNGLVESELVHVFGGHFDATPRPDPGEVEDWRWESVPAIAADVARHPERYSVWFRRYITEFREALAPLT
jgi:isopentenyl-diphosphate delta-isomerase